MHSLVLTPVSIVTTGFLAEETEQTPGLALCLGSVQKGDRPGFYPSAPSSGKSAFAKLGAAPAARQVLLTQPVSVL